MASSLSKQPHKKKKEDRSATILDGHRGQSLGLGLLGALLEVQRGLHC
jgi:hypothetical protein